MIDQIEEITMTPDELYEQFYDDALSKMICKHMAGKSVMVAYVTLGTLMGGSIGTTSLGLPEMQHAMYMCGQIVANAAQATYEGQNHDEPAAGVSKLQ